MPLRVLSTKVTEYDRTRINRLAAAEGKKPSGYVASIMTRHLDHQDAINAFTTNTEAIVDEDD